MVLLTSFEWSTIAFMPIFPKIPTVFFFAICKLCSMLAYHVVRMGPRLSVQEALILSTD